MAELLLYLALLIVGLFFLIKSSVIFTDSSKQIGKALRMPQFIIGLTIVALGTSTPELIVGLVSTLRNQTSIVVGTVIGSNIANILLILGISAIVAKTLTVQSKNYSIDIFFFASSALLLSVFMLDTKISLLEVIISLSLLIVYLYYDQRKVREIEKDKELKPLKAKYFLTLGLSILVLYFSAELVVKAITSISTALGISQAIVAVSSIAIGTSLPELTVTINAILQKNQALAVGNIVGSNIFNTLLVVGVAGLFKPLTVEPVMITIGIPFLLLSTLLFMTVFFMRQIKRWHGIMFLAIYAFFLVLLYF
ncbi:calcium/sodium antiporter [Candidatus Woesearchaeota archaeon]|nr:calcium/sodium antiporter [Candidatus Woesearchaeota archaeon]